MEVVFRWLGIEKKKTYLVLIFKQVDIFFARGDIKLDDDVKAYRLFDQLSVLFLVVVLWSVVNVTGQHGSWDYFPI